MRPDLRADPMALSNIMDFDHVIEVLPDGDVIGRPDLWAPELHDSELEGDTWHLLNGYSGQYRYSGPIMHASELIAGGMARDILDEPGIYVALVDYPTDDTEPDGWAVARKETE